MRVLSLGINSLPGLVLFAALAPAAYSQSILYTFDGDSANAWFGTSVSDAGDVNGDGYADLIVGASGEDNYSGSARAFSGRDGSILYTFDGDAAQDSFGVSVSGAGDVNGDGFDDIIVGASHDDNNGTDTGSATVFPGGDTLGTIYCDSSQNPNNAAGISISTLDSSAPSISLTLIGGPPGQFCYLLVGNSNGVVSQPPGSKGDLCIVGGSCLGRYDKDVFAIDSSGSGTTDIKNALSNPCNGGVTILPGSTWYWQYWHRQPMGQPATFSAALETTFN